MKNEKKNGFFINPATNTSELADIRVKDGLIIEIGALEPLNQEEVLEH